jgi:hypothetical protein
LTAPPRDLLEQIGGELWISLASLLRSYTAAHGLNGNRQAAVEQDEKRIEARHGEHWLELRRTGSTVSWRRDDGQSGMLELTEDGRLRSQYPMFQNRDMGQPAEEDEEMDLAAERWARELMQ